MKKLLVTAIGAAAALGAYAGEISRQAIGDFGSTGPVTTNDLNTTLGNYWSELPGSSNNTYAVSTLSSVGEIATPISPISGKSLDIKTTFGKPLSVSVASGGAATNIPNSGIYFDSLVKFTVCEDTPDQEYSGAKIIMWLQEQYGEGDTITGTNLMVRAGYMVRPGEVVATNYQCGTTIEPDFADKWHRITIKAMADITVDGGLGHIPVPGFAIFIDSDRTVATLNVPKWGDAFNAPLTEAAEYYGENKLFPSMIQDSQDSTKGSLTCASFDGTGSLTDIVFTDEAPIDEARNHAAKKAHVWIGDNDLGQFETLEAALAEVTNLTDEQTALLRLERGLTVDKPLTVNADRGTVVVDFAGYVLTNKVADAMITNNAAQLVITNSVGNGGIYCTDTDNGTAIYNDGGLTFTAGDEGTSLTIDGLIVEGENSGIDNVSGGSFRDQTVEGHLAEGKVLVENQETGLFDVVDYVPPTYVAEIVGGDSYETLEDAWADIADGDTLKILGTISNVVQLATLDGNKSVTFDLNGQKIVTNQKYENYWLTIAAGSTLVVTDSTVSATGKIESRPTKQTIFRVQGTFTLAAGTLDMTTVDAGNSASGFNVKNGGTGYMNGGRVMGRIASGEDGATLAMNGGVVDIVLSKDGGAVTINGGDVTATEKTGTGTGTIVIPSDSAARFGADQTQYCASGYKTVQSGDWWIVTAKEYYTAIELNTNTLALVTNETFTLTATTTPASAADDSVTWTTSDASVATVADGVVTAVGAGTATITVATENCSDTCVVTVTAPSPTPETPTIPAGQSTVVVDADPSAEPAVVAAGVRVENATSVDDVTYQGYFTKAATYSSETGKWTVTAEFTDTVKSDATTTAAAIVSGTAASGNVTVPAGIYYKITTYTALGGTAVQTLNDQSDGTGISVNKPGTTQGFIKVEMATVPFD